MLKSNKQCNIPGNPAGRKKSLTVFGSHVKSEFTGNTLFSGEHSSRTVLICESLSTTYLDQSVTTAIEHISNVSHQGRKLIKTKKKKTNINEIASLQQATLAIEFKQYSEI